jgi:hypothetical protein
MGGVGCSAVFARFFSEENQNVRCAPRAFCRCKYINKTINLGLGIQLSDRAFA